MYEKIDVLIVDDRKENLLVLENLLANNDIRIIKANSGEEALSLTFDYNFAVILLDVEMPGMNGFETAEYMRGSDKTRNIPIIFLTAHKDEQNVFRGYDSGAVDFISKPIEPRILNNKVKVFIEMFRQTRMLKEQSVLLAKSVEEMKVAKEEAVNANRMKSQFIANTSHELRTPLNAIIGISKMLMKYNAENLKNEQKEGLDAINKSGARLLNLINELLDLSKIEAGKMEVFLSPFYVNDMLDQMKTMMTALIKNKEIKFIVEKNDNVPTFIAGDEKKIIQVIVNLLSNAVKFTDKGEIILKVYVQEERIYFEVKDSGIGIMEGDIGKLFQNFSQIDGSLSRQHSGTGLGLSLSKKIVELLKGEIFIESIYRKGTTISFYIPKLDIEEFKIEEIKKLCEFTPTAITRNKKILVVEDEEYTRLTIKMMLREKYDLIFAENGSDAIDRFEKEKPDLVLMDIMMPRMDGIEALKEIKKIDTQIPILAFTSMAMEDELKKIMENGFDGYIIKPVEEELLFEMLEKFLGGGDVNVT